MTNLDTIKTALEALKSNTQRCMMSGVDSIIIDDYQPYHNYVRHHMTLNGKTATDICGIEIQGNNKWKTIIENASL